MEATVTILYQVSQVMLVVAVVVFLYRFSLGPSVFDRVVAVEAIGLGAVGYLLVESNVTASRLYTDAALGLALFSVVGTIFLGYFLQCLYIFWKTRASITATWINKTVPNSCIRTDANANLVGICTHFFAKISNLVHKRNFCR